MSKTQQSDRSRFVIMQCQNMHDKFVNVHDQPENITFRFLIPENHRLTGGFFCQSILKFNQFRIKMYWEGVKKITYLQFTQRGVETLFSNLNFCSFK